MAFNLQTFKTRTLTAAVFVVVMLLGLLWNQWSFFLLFTIIHFGCWNEYQRLVALIDPGYKSITPFHKYGVMIAGWCIMLYLTNDSFRVGDLRLHKIGLWLGLIIVFVLSLMELLLALKIRPKLIAHSFFGLIYISLSLGLMINLFGIQHDSKEDDEASPLFRFSWTLPAFIIACMWINDTMAYIVGSLIGKRPLSKISPKKTWEGTIGGVILCIVVAGYGMSLILSNEENQLNNFSNYHWYGIAGIAAITGTLGDILESKLKRLAGVKDSGHIMPGHGGFLDRFDSLLVATPFVWLYVNMLL